MQMTLECFNISTESSQSLDKIQDLFTIVSNVISRFNFKHEADLSVSIESVMASSVWEMRSTESPLFRKISNIFLSFEKRFNLNYYIPRQNLQ